MTRILWVLLMMAVAGCTGSSTKPEVSADSAAQLWASRLASLAPRETWVLDGRIAVQRGSEGGQARLHWAQEGATFALKITAPLGQGTYLLQGDPEGVAMETPQGRVEALDLATLMTTHLRWNLPVAGARYWILGLPIPGHPLNSLRLDGAGRLTDMAQDGWRISVLDYQTVGTTDLPRKLFLTANDLQLRLAITQWSQPPR